MSAAQWIGRSETRPDTVAEGPVAALSATLDRDDPLPLSGDALPPLWHWLFFLDRHRASELGPDGHARRGGLLPPIALPRRMWAGSRFEFHHPLRIGDRITRETRVIDIKEKLGRSGPLVFVMVRHEIFNDAGLAIVEEHDIVYRDHSRDKNPAASMQPAPTDAVWERTIHADDVLLFPIFSR